LESYQSKDARVEEAHDEVIVWQTCCGRVGILLISIGKKYMELSGLLNS